MNAYRSGNLALVNAPGTGVADDKAIYPFVPAMIKFYLNQDPILDNVKTFICAEEPDRQYVLEHLHELVVKSTNESGGYGMLMGHQASKKAEDARHLRKRSGPAPHGICRSSRSSSSVQHPSLVEDRFAGRASDLDPIS